MRRREFIAGLGGVVAWPFVPLAAEAQRRVGALINGTDDPRSQFILGAFREGLATFGWSEGRNLRIDYRFSGGDPSRLAADAEELVNLRPDVIFALSGPVARAVQQRTSVLPIVFVGGGDPATQTRLVRNIARPEGNMTGFANNFGSLGGRWLELFKEAVPRLTRVAHIFFVNEIFVRSENREPQGVGAEFSATIAAAAAQLGVTIIRMPARNAVEIEPAINAFAAEPDGGVLLTGAVPPSTFEAIGRLALYHHPPLMAGGGNGRFGPECMLMAHGPDLPDLARRASSYVDRILRGTKPSELPVQYPTKLELVVPQNRKGNRGDDPRSFSRTGRPGDRMKRREFIAGLGGAVAWPLAARAQKATTPVVGYLSVGSQASNADSVASFLRGLGDGGYVEGRNVAIEYRWAENRAERLPALAADLVQRQVAVIFTSGKSGPPAAKAGTATIPIVFQMGEDPVKEGIVARLDRPGGNITGFSNFTNGLFSKRLGLLLDIAARAEVFAFLVNPNNPNADPDTKDVQAAAAAAGRRLEVLRAGSDRELGTAFVAMVQRRIGGLIVGVDPLFFGTRRALIAALAIHHAIPAIYNTRAFAVAGGLMSYGTDQFAPYRQGGLYVARILKGENPGDLPVQLPTKFEFVINLNTAKALSLDIQPMLLANADEVIE